MAPWDPVSSSSVLEKIPGKADGGLTSIPEFRLEEEEQRRPESPDSDTSGGGGGGHGLTLPPTTSVGVMT